MINAAKSVVITLEEISDRKKREELDERAIKYHLKMMENFPSIVWKTDTEAKIVYINQNTTEFTGFSLKEIIEYGRFNLIHPDDIPLCLETFNTVIESHENYEIQCRLRNSKGQYCWFQVIGRPFYDIEDNFDGYIGMALDINEKKQAEAVLNMYRILSEKTRDIILFVNMDGKIIEANESAVKSYGYTREELLNININLIIKTSDLPDEEVGGVEGTRAFVDTINYRKDGSFFPVEISTESTIIDGKRILVSIIRDITERKKAEKMINESQSKYQSLFLNMSNAFTFEKIIFDENNEPKDLELVEVNATFERLFGLQANELIGKTVFEVFPEFAEYYLDLVRLNYKENSNLNKIKTSEYYSKGFGMWCSITTFSPAPGYLATILQDITERKFSDIKLKKSEEKYRSLFVNLNSGFVYNKLIMDEEGNVLDMKYIEINEAFERMFGCDRKDVIGKHFTEVHYFDKQLFLKNLRKAYISVVTTGESVSINEMYIPKLKKWFSLALYSPEKDHIATIITDIDNKKKAEIQIIKAKEDAEIGNKAKSEFLANMSHEIRTPLNGILGMIELTLLTELKETQKENLIIAQRCADSLLDVINDILDFSKMEAGKLIIEKTNFNINTLIDEIVKSYALDISKKKLKLNVTISPDVPQYLIGDPNRLRQIINNLISNSIKFTEKGQINLSIRMINSLSDNIEIIFEVADSGIGISPEGKERLFKSFSQVDSSFTRKYGGSGLGLVISKQLVEMMDGKIWMESEKGKGSTFYFTAIFDLGDKPIQQPTNLAPVNASVGRIEVLLVEDVNVNQLVLSSMLKKRGHSVDIAGNGLEAVSMHKQKKYDVILMDIQMPVMDGIEATKRIRELEGATMHTPIIALTAFALKGDKERFMAMGMDEYISKPVKMDEFFETIERISIKNCKPSEDFNGVVKLNDNGELVYTEYIEEKSQEEILSVIKEIENYVEELRVAISYNGMSDIENISHKIKELSNQIDAEELKSSAFKIELATRRGNIEQVIEYSIQFQFEFETYKKSVK